MNRIRVISGLLVAITVIFGFVLFQNKDVLFGSTKPSAVNKELNQNSSAPQKIETQFKKSGKFTEGVWIKKYPDNFACFKFETPDGFIIIADPYNMNETVHPDVVTESHQHGDHTDVSKLTKPYKLMNSVENYTRKGVTITGFPGRHNKGDQSETNDMILFEINGVKIAHFASQGELPSDAVLKKMKNVDILLIQASIRPSYADSKLTLKECDHIIKILNPKIVIPEHGTPTISVAFAKFYNIPDEYASNGEIVVTRSKLDSIKSLKIIDLDTDVTESY
jgi:hypothetical protein